MVFIHVRLASWLSNEPGRQLLLLPGADGDVEPVELQQGAAELCGEEQLPIGHAERREIRSAQEAAAQTWP